MIAITLAVSVAGVGKTIPWDAVLFDISGDIAAQDRSGRSEIQLLSAIVDEMGKYIDENDSVGVFANGRVFVTLKALRADAPQNYSFLRLSIGDGTRIYDSALSVAAADGSPKRILIVTNGTDNRSSFHPKTASKLLRSKGIVVDALCFYIDADSVGADSIFFRKNPFDKRFKEAIKSTGGSFVHIKDESQIPVAISKLLKGANPPKGLEPRAAAEYDEAILNATLNRITSRALLIQEVDTSACLKYNGTVFYGLNDIYRHHSSPQPGVYVGIDSSRYPCFDDSDWLYENRYYQNIYFGDSTDRINACKSNIESVKPSANYCKLHNATPVDILPMIYYRGEGDKMLICGLEIVPTLVWDHIDIDKVTDGD